MQRQIVFQSGSLRIDADTVEAAPIRIQRSIPRSNVRVSTPGVYTCYAYIESLPKVWKYLMENKMSVGVIHIKTSLESHRLLGNVKILDYDETQKLIKIQSTQYS